MSAVGNPIPTNYLIPPYMSKKLVEHYDNRGMINERNEQLDSNDHVMHIRELRGVHYPPAPVLEEKNPGKYDGALKPATLQVWDQTDGKPVTHIERYKSHDPDVIACYENMEKVEEFYLTHFKRNTLLVPNRTMRSHIHYKHAFNNAFWHSQKMVTYFGESDPQIFTQPFSRNKEIAYHEWGHAITTFSSNLEYRDESGALNESLSDVLTKVLVHKSEGKKGKEAGWDFARGIIQNSDGTPASLRSFSEPGRAYVNHPILGTDSQVAHMRNYFHDKGPDAGVHTNSGIPNHAFYIFTVNKLQKASYEEPGTIWYQTLLNSNQDETFRGFAGKSITVAKRLGYRNGVINALGQAWMEVGIKPERGWCESIKDKAPTKKQLQAGGVALALLAVVTTTRAMINYTN